MKAIVANVLFGGILGCLNYANSVHAEPILPLAQLPQSSVTAIPQMANSISRALDINGLPSSNTAISRKYHQWLQQRSVNYFKPSILSFSARIAAECESSVHLSKTKVPADDRWSNSCILPQRSVNPLLKAPKKPYRHQSGQGDLVLGFQKTFWSAEERGKYWGITTVEHWGNQTGQTSKKPGFTQLNYLNSAPKLASGSSTLTFSGGGNQNLVRQDKLAQDASVSQEFKNFRGGMIYHRGVAKQLTMGVGFFYQDIENVLVGFTQFTYKSDVLPLETTVSMLTQESATDFHSHIQFKPASNFVANYYGDYGDVEHHKFDANWGIYPGLNLVAKANSKHKSYSTGIKIALRSNYFSVTATAALDKEQNLQWKLDSQIGRFKFAHSSDRQKSKSELSNKLLDSHQLGLQCSSFVQYETRQTKKDQQEFTVWGGKIQSQAKVGKNQHQWQFSLGYGTSSHGEGWIANGSVALQPDLFLKLNYQEISAVADETKIKLQLSSN